jgi:hypothetical protein
MSTRPGRMVVRPNYTNPTPFHVLCGSGPKHLVDRARVRFGENELDVACGTGVVTPARQSGTGRVVGLDLNADMLRVARGIAHAEYVRLSGVRDALALPLRKGRLQRRSMSARPPALFGEIPRPPRDGSRSHVQRLLICVFTPMERTPVAYAFANALDLHFGEVRRSRSLPSTPSRIQILSSVAVSSSGT